MSLTADSLKNNEVQKKAVAREVMLVLAQIDDALKSAHQSGKHIAVIPTPITFSVPYMNGADSQRRIYYKILSDLIKRGFTVKLKMSKDCTLFIVSWLSDDEQRELKEQNAILAKHTFKDVKNTDL